MVSWAQRSQSPAIRALPIGNIPKPASVCVLHGSIERKYLEQLVSIVNTKFFVKMANMRLRRSIRYDELPGNLTCRVALQQKHENLFFALANIELAYNIIDSHLT